MEKYKDFIEQTYGLLNEEFTVKNDELSLYDVPLMQLIEKYGTPLKLSYLPSIPQKINYAKQIFNDAMQKYNYQGEYIYCYCTKSSHFEFVLDEILKQNVHIETSSAFDIALLRKLYQKNKITKDTIIIANGFKRDLYKQYLSELINDGFHNCIPVLDNLDEINEYDKQIKNTCKIGIRIATEEEPLFNFYTSRLGVRYDDVMNLYTQKIAPNPKFELKLLHFFVNQGISDRAYYWNELSRFIHKYCELKAICPSLDSIDIGGGFPIKKTLDDKYDYKHIAEVIIEIIVRICEQNNTPTPNILTEFGTFTVGESGAVIYKILNNKLQNDKEEWYMIDGSFITNLPDTWAMNQKYILLAINNWDKPYTNANLGGLTCDSMDYYNFDRHQAQIYLPKIREEKPLYVGFFHTGAYQEAIGGFGGIQHCLIPSPKHIVINKDENGKLTDYLFSPEQDEKDVLDILGY